MSGGLSENRVTSSTAPAEADPAKSMQTKMTPAARCSQCEICAQESGWRTCTRVRVAIMCQRQAIAANGTM